MLVLELYTKASKTLTFSAGGRIILPLRRIRERYDVFLYSDSGYMHVLTNSSDFECRGQQDPRSGCLVHLSLVSICSEDLLVVC